MAGYDGSIRIDTRVNTNGFNTGVKQMTAGLAGIRASLTKLAGAVGIAFGVAAIVNFGKKSVDAATELTNALMGLQSIMNGQGRSFKDARNWINSYVEDGLIPATQAITAYKNLALRGYDDSQIQKVLIALKDSAAFGRQASYSLGEAVMTATEGLKNENSILVDNAGVTKNVSKMWDDYAKSIGTTAKSLTKQQKIQAEVNGILEETRFQTGDAAKIANSYSGQVLQLGFNFNNLKIAMGNAILPIAEAALPGINKLIEKFTLLANLIAQVTTALFGKRNKQAEKQNAVASTAKEAAAGQTELAEATEKAGKAAKGALAGFDELNVLQQQTAGTTLASPGIEDISGGGAAAEDEEIGSIEIPPEVLTFIDKLKEKLNPLKEALAGLWGEFERLGGFVWEGLVDFYNTFLVPVGNWLFGEDSGLTRFVKVLRDGMSKVNWQRINDALHEVWEALAPFAINVGEGLLWLWENVLVPFGTWTLNEIVPRFLRILALAIDKLNSIIEIAKPVLSWLWEKFLKPLAKWAADRILEQLDWLIEDIEKMSIAMKGFAETFKVKWAEIEQKLDNIGPWLKDNVFVWFTKEKWLEVFDGIKEGLTAKWQEIVGWWDTNGAVIWISEHVEKWFTLSYWKSMFAGIKDGLAAQWDDIKNWWDNSFIVTFLNDHILKWFTKDAWIENLKGLAAGFKEAWRNAANGAIEIMEKAINWIIEKINTLSWDIPAWVPLIGGSTWGFNVKPISIDRIPALATGAVIPPNAQFMAILGDQKHGRNLEAPEGLIRQIIREEMAGLQTGGTDVSITFEGSLAQLGRVLNPVIKKEQRRIGPSLRTGGVF